MRPTATVTIAPVMPPPAALPSAVPMSTPPRAAPPRAGIKLCRIVPPIPPPTAPDIVLSRGDGSIKRSTGCGKTEIKKAQRVLADYQIAKYSAPRVRDRDPGSVKIADVISIYAEDVAPTHTRPKETAARLERLLDFFRSESLLYINKRTCGAYVSQRSSDAAARRELEDLRAAIRYHWQNGYCAALTPVVLPDRNPGRDRWLTRSEAARLLWAAWRLRQPQHGHITERPTAQHVARFHIGCPLYRNEGGRNLQRSLGSDTRARVDRPRTWGLLSAPRRYPGDQKATTAGQIADAATSHILGAGKGWDRPPGRLWNGMGSR